MGQAIEQRQRTTGDRFDLTRAANRQKTLLGLVRLVRSR